MVTRWFSARLKSKLLLPNEDSLIKVDLQIKDIILTNGCSHALEMCINVVADANDNILVPRPGFPLYVTLCQSLQIEPRYYKLKVSFGSQATVF